MAKAHFIGQHDAPAPHGDILADLHAKVDALHEKLDAVLKHVTPQTTAEPAAAEHTEA